MKWLDALKQWNASHGGRYTIPKKGSEEYNQVRVLQGIESPPPSPPEHDEEASRIADEAVAMEKPKKVRKPRAKKVQPEEPSYE